MTEERSIGYEEGYQAGWNAAMDAKPEQPAQQEPVAYAVFHRMGGGKSLHWPEQHSPDGDANKYLLVPLYNPQPTLSLEQRIILPDAITDDSESPEYRTGWNECREVMRGMLK